MMSQAGCSDNTPEHTVSLTDTLFDVKLGKDCLYLCTRSGVTLSVPTDHLTVFDPGPCVAEYVLENIHLKQKAML